MEKIVPSKPFSDTEEIANLASKISGKLTRIQTDICDGKFVKSVSWPVSEFGINGFCNLALKKDLDVYMPRWEEINYTADLMVFAPEKYIDSLVQYGYDEVIVHFRSVKNEEEWEEIFQKCANYELSLNVAFDVSVGSEIMKNFLQKNQDKFTGVQIMGIKNIGFQGQPFEEKSLDYVREVKKTFTKLSVFFDGAINDETVEVIKNTGVDVFCVGSFLTNGETKEVLKFLRTVI